MAELSTIARPYAKAAFQTAVEGEALSDWSDMLNLTAQVVVDDTMLLALGNPGLTAAQQAAIFVDVCGDKLSEKGQNFICTLSENKRLSLLPQIAEQFEAFKAELQRSVDVDITSAFDLSEDQTQKLAQALKAKLNRDVNVTSTTDKALVGGLIIRAGDVVIDGSIRGKLAKLAESLNS
jgi:F-type H+-transporting ATPase subunit delta